MRIGYAMTYIRWLLAANSFWAVSRFRTARACSDTQTPMSSFMPSAMHCLGPWERAISDGITRARTHDTKGCQASSCWKT
jgi:hypothetical protein